MARALVSLGIISVALALLAAFLREPISMGLMRSGLERNMAADPIAELPDGLHAVVCGAGGPLPDPRRSAPCLAIVAGPSLYLVDAGSGAARSLARAGFSPARVEGVFLTHFHSDHIDGLGELSLLRWTGGGWKSPLPLYGPEGVQEVAAGLNQAYRLDAVYRTAHHGTEVAPPTGSGLRARAFVEPTAGGSPTVLEHAGLRVTSFRVEHDPAAPAVGYRFEYGGRSIVVSGDSARSENLARFASGADLLVHDALSPELMGVVREAAVASGRQALARIARDVLDYHASPVEAAAVAESAGVRHLLFHHVVPPLPIPGLPSVFLDGVDEAYGGGVTLGEDGIRISLPAGSEAIEVSGG